MENTETIESGEFSVRLLSAPTLSSRVLGESYRIMSQQLPTTLFTRLGGFFFRTLIQRAVQHGKAEFVVATSDNPNRVDGFALLVHTKSWISETVRRYPAAFAMAAGSALVKPAVWVRLISRFQNRFSQRSVGQEGQAAHELQELPQSELYMLAVRPGREGRGCGRALMQGIERSVERGGSARYAVFTQVTNHRANRFYQKNGLRRLGNVQPIAGDMNVYVKDLRAGRGGERRDGGSTTRRGTTAGTGRRRARTLSGWW